MKYLLILFLITSTALGQTYIFKSSSADATKELQAAVKKYRDVTISGNVKVNSSGITIPSKTTIRGGTVQLIASDKTTYRIFYIRDVSDVTIIGTKIIGDRYTATKPALAKPDGAGHAVSIVGSTRIKLDNVDTQNAWTDGIYIGVSSKQNYSKDITLINPYCRGNGRNGLSVISVDGLLIDGGNFLYNNRTKPMYGIDFEPNNNTEILKNIEARNITTSHNPGGGIQVTLTHMYGINPKEIDILLVNHTSRFDRDGFRVSAKVIKGKPISGKVTTKSPYYSKYLRNPVTTDKTDNALTVNIVSPRLQPNTGIGSRIIKNQAEILEILKKKGSIYKDLINLN